MSTFYNPEKFPVHALGQLLGNAVLEATQATANTVSPNAVALLTGISLCTQGLVEVEKRPGLRSPLSFFFAVIQPSGERKSASLQKVLAPVRAFSTEAAAIHKAALVQFDAAMAAWKAEERGIQNAIRRKSENDEDVGPDRERLSEHAKRKPRKPKRLKLIHENVTQNALWTSFAESLPTTSLISDEGHTIIACRALSDPGLFNKAWDSSTLIIDRVTSGELVIENPVLTVLLQFQPGVFHELMSKKGDLLRDSGFFARCFVIAPPVTAGSRHLANAPDPTTHNLTAVHDRLIELLKMHNLDAQGDLQPRQVLKFSPEAQARWESQHDHIESAMQDGGYFFNFRDFASKHADKIARLAGLLHFFEGQEGLISLRTLDRAIIICNWFAAEFVSLFAPQPIITQDQQDAFDLQDWLVASFQQSGYSFVRKNDILQIGPNPIRSKARTNAALRNLNIWGITFEWKDPEDRKNYVGLTREFLQRHLGVY